MPEKRQFFLEPVVTDGWFESVAEEIGSFQTLCEVIGERFFAFSLVSGAKITALIVDRCEPDDTMVEFVIGDDDDEETSDDDVERLALSDFRRQLVSVLTAQEPTGPPPRRDTDTEGIQRFIGLRTLLLAPLFGYHLLELTLEDKDGSSGLLRVQHDGVEQGWTLGAFRSRLRSHVRDELRKVSQSSDRRNLLDFARVDDAIEAAKDGDHRRVVDLLGAWPSPLSVLLRTPEGQLLGADAKATLARGLTLLGAAWAELGQGDRGEDVLRLAVQYAGDHAVAGEVFLGLGEILQSQERDGEAIGLFRRAANLGADGKRVWPRLAQAFLARHRYVAALGSVLEARDAGVEAEELAESMTAIRDALGAPLDSWAALTGTDIS